MAPVFSGAFRSEFETLLRWRRDVRRFLPDPVPGPVLDRILALADLAPSVGNSQPWRIVIVSDEIRRSAIIQSFEAENEIAAGQYDGEKGRLYRQLKLSGLKEAPVHLAIFSEDNPEQGDGLGRMSMPETLAYSTVSMIHTLWLAARTEGVGVGWVSILDPVEVTRALDVDPDWRLVAYLCVGYPQEEHIDPELERARWQARTPLASRLIYR
nr:5,6-dimethylbenzimidazole synthase [Roseibium denhamense]